MIETKNTNEEEKYPIRKDWEEYYKVLEGIRRTGVVNMFGAAVYLEEFCPELTERQAQEVLVNWMKNYAALGEKYGW